MSALDITCIVFLFVVLGVGISLKTYVKRKLESMDGMSNVAVVRRSELNE